jgi:hypothetical protein
MVKMGPWFEQAWKIISEDVVQWFLIGLVATVIMGASYCIPIAGFWIAGPINVGLLLAIRARWNGQRPDINHLWEGFQFTGVAGLYLLLYWVLVSVGLLLCIIPGFILGAWWCLALIVIHEEGLGAWEAMQRSKELVSKDLWNWLLLIVVLGLGYSVVSMVPVIGGALGFVFIQIVLFIGYKAVAHGETVESMATPPGTPPTPGGAPPGVPPTTPPPGGTPPDAPPPPSGGTQG